MSGSDVRASGDKFVKGVDLLCFLLSNFLQSTIQSVNKTLLVKSLFTDYRFKKVSDSVVGPNDLGEFFLGDLDFYCLLCHRFILPLISRCSAVIRV